MTSLVRQEQACVGGSECVTPCTSVQWCTTLVPGRLCLHSLPELSSTQLPLQLLELELQLNQCRL